MRNHSEASQAGEDRPGQKKRQVPGMFQETHVAGAG